MRALRSAIVLGLASGCAGGGSGSNFTATTLATAGVDSSSSGAQDESSSGPTGSTGDSGGASTGGAQDESTSGPGSSTGGGTTCGAVLETFAQEPPWTVVGLPDGSNDYGWRTTANAGGELGEIGGNFQRSATLSFYADTGINSASASECIAASGRIAVTMQDATYDTNLVVGHFDPSDATGHVGFVLSEGTGHLRVYMIAGGLSLEVLQLPTPSADLGWSYEYDPTGTGVMTFALEGFGSQSMPLDAIQQSAIAGISAFGVAKPGLPMPELDPGLLGLYLDEIEYTR